MYRKKHNHTRSKALRVSILILAMGTISFVNFGQFWTAPDYVEDGTAAHLVEACVRYGGDWIEYSQKWDGSFYYIYYPEEDTYSTANNILRHAGTVYSVLLLYEYTQELRYLRVGYKGIGFLLRHLGQVDEETSFIKYNDKVKLGGAALCLLCLTKYKELTDTPYFDEVMVKMGNFLLYMQKENGWFESTYYYEGDYVNYFNSSIYPGEAMLALARLYQTTAEEKYLEALDLAYSYYSNLATFNWRNMAFVPWTTSAFAEAYHFEENADYADFALAMSDFVLGYQISEDTYDEQDHNLKGGFGSEPSVNTASYMEGLGDAYKLALKLNYSQKIEDYREALIWGAEWILSLQYRHKKIEDLTCPRRAFGGFHHSFKGEGWSDIRVDYTQHSISALLRLLEAFTEAELDAIEIR